MTDSPSQPRPAITDPVRQLLAVFDALSDSDKGVAMAEIRRLPADGDVPWAALHAAADALFSVLDAKEAARANT